MSKQPVVSFVIPVYRKPAEVFEKCLFSLFDMSLKDIEVICVFDGENEDLQKVAGKYKQVKQIVIPHGGAPKARNTGLEVAAGKYVAMWDADCVIKPDHAKRMVEEFEAVHDADFVYSGYEMAEGQGEFSSEAFDPYSLTCGNYISSMAFIRRDKAHKWDESLSAAQDWDYWLTAVERGLKGVFVEGSGFVTYTYDSGLSSDKWSADKRDITIETVRKKHGIENRSIGVFSLNYRERALKIAKILDGDLIKPTGPTPTTYKTIMNIGYSFMSRFEGITDDVVKIQYWVPGEIAGLAEAKYAAVIETVRIAKTVINYCGTDYEKNKLADLGIEAEVLPLALAQEDLEKIQHTLPEKFTVLVATDQAYSDLLKDLVVDLPHIRFIYNSARVDDFSCFLSFYQFAALDNAMLIAHVNGRHVLSNVQAPYCGFIDPEQTWEEFKKQLYSEIRNIRNKPFNIDAQAYYAGETNPERFRHVITSLSSKLEVI